MKVEGLGLLLLWGCLVQSVRVYSIIPFLTPEQEQSEAAPGPCQDELLVICGMSVPKTRRADFDARACLSDNLDQVQESCEEFLTYQFPSIVNKCHREIEAYCSYLIDSEPETGVRGQDLSDDRYLNCLLDAQTLGRRIGNRCSAAVKDVVIEQQALAEETKRLEDTDFLNNRYPKSDAAPLLTVQNTIEQFDAQWTKPVPSKVESTTASTSFLDEFLAVLAKLPYSTRRRNTVESNSETSYNAVWSLDLPRAPRTIPFISNILESIIDIDEDAPISSATKSNLRQQRHEDRQQLARFSERSTNAVSNQQSTDTDNLTEFYAYSLANSPGNGDDNDQYGYYYYYDNLAYYYYDDSEVQSNDSLFQSRRQIRVSSSVERAPQ